MDNDRHPIAAAGWGCGICALEVAMKSTRMALILIVVGLVAGCAGPRTGATFDTLTNSIKPLKAGEARIVVFRDKGFPGIFDIGWQARLDGEPMGDLKTGTFVYRDRAPGAHQLTFERFGDLSRASHREFTAAPGRTYVFRLEMNDKGKMVVGGSLAGLSGIIVTSAIAANADDRGLFDFNLLEDTAAREAMAELHLAD